MKFRQWIFADLSLDPSVQKQHRHLKRLSSASNVVPEINPSFREPIMPFENDRSADFSSFVALKKRIYIYIYI